MTRKIIEAKGLEKIVRLNETELTILKGINLDIKQSESFAILGTSGSGKTTLLSLLAGLDLPSKGEVWIKGTEITQLSEEDRANVRLNQVGFVFQGFQLLANLTALENVMLPSELRGDKDAEERALALLDRVGLSKRVNHQPNQLSGGEQQRVAIARAFASSAGILFADEPTGNLDSATGARVIDIMFELNRELGTTLVLVTHDQMLSKYCDRSLRLESGVVVS
ncbi:MAG: ABC transporter [Gammaproteobacteria bacterium TMED180]|mgnify:FL=1|nr:MAG: ABC transporter [Gammaproteobacteria bacterium TMED180]